MKHPMPMAVFVLIFFLQASCHKDPPLYESIPDEPYGSDVRNKMDVFLPIVRDSSTETVVLIHG